jgi:hypothetical protein
VASPIGGASHSISPARTQVDVDDRLRVTGSDRRDARGDPWHDKRAESQGVASIRTCNLQRFETSTRVRVVDTECNARPMA